VNKVKKKKVKEELNKWEINENKIVWLKLNDVKGRVNEKDKEKGYVFGWKVEKKERKWWYGMTIPFSLFLLFHFLF